MSTEKTIRKTVLVDFDKVIHSYYDGWGDGTIYGTPMEGAKEGMLELMKNYKVKIFTARINPDPFGQMTSEQIKKLPKDKAIVKSKEMVDVYQSKLKELTKWLVKHGFIEGKHYEAITYLKEGSIAIIDDRAVEFAVWDKSIIERVKKLD